MIFQSTPPARGATAIPCPRWAAKPSFQSTPPARGATPDVLGDIRVVEFQSTPPARGATFPSWKIATALQISIHAPREGGDSSYIPAVQTAGYFNPRPPRGGRLRVAEDGRWRSEFQSTPPARGATTYLHTCDYWEEISIHAPREGGDSKDAQFYLRIFDKQVELLRFLGKIRGGCLRNPEKGRRFLGKSLANLPEIAGHLDFAGGGKAHPGYPCAVPLPRRAVCVRGSGDPPADRCSSYRNAPLFSHIASPDSKSADCLSQNP